MEDMLAMDTMDMEAMACRLSVSIIPMVMLPLDTISLTPSEPSTSPRGLLMLMPTMAMVTMAPLPLDSPPSPMLASPSRDMPRDMAMDSMARGLLTLMPTMAMVTMAPLPLDSPPPPMLASPSRDMPRDMAMDSMVITR